MVEQLTCCLNCNLFLKQNCRSRYTFMFLHISFWQGGGSEVWNSDDTLSIASLTFHPSDNVVVFAVSNKLHFWDWTRSEPFAVCETTHDFEKIR